MVACVACSSEAVEEADGEMMCMDCGEVQEATNDASGIKVGEIMEVSKVPGKDKLSKLSVNVGNVEPLQIVTSAPNVKLGARIAIATVGTAVGDPDDGEVVKKTAVGGVPSYGMVCDGPMLGWGASNKGLAALLPMSYAIGSVPPDKKPRGDS